MINNLCIPVLRRMLRDIGAFWGHTFTLKSLGLSDILVIKEAAC
jgi:hypothetical protein